MGTIAQQDFLPAKKKTITLNPEALLRIPGMCSTVGDYAVSVLPCIPGQVDE